MNKAYFMTWKDQRKQPVYSVFPTQETGPARELIANLEGKNRFICDGYFRKITVGDTGLIYEPAEPEADVWKDYPANALATALCSAKMRDIINSSITDYENVDWIEWTVEHAGSQKQYYLLRFNEILDVVDKASTTYVRGTDHIIKPTFSSRSLDRFHIFTVPRSHNLWKITSGIYVTEEVRAALKDARIAGIEFSPCAVQ